VPGGGFGGNKVFFCLFKVTPRNFHRFSALKRPNSLLVRSGKRNGDASQLLRRAIAGATCPHGLVSRNPSDVPCACDGMLCQRVSEPFFLLSKKSLFWPGLAAATEKRAVL